MIKQVAINGIAYDLNSDNELLLKEMPPVKVKDPATGKWVGKIYKYIPIGIIKTLLRWLTDSYDCIDHGAKYVEEYSVEKEYQGKKEIINKRAYEYSVEYIIRLNGEVTRLVGYCRGTAPISVLHNDWSANGFFQKLAARATKSALKNFAKVFMMDDEADDVIEWEQVAAGNTDKPVEEPAYVPKEDKKKSKSSKAATSTAETPVVAEPAKEPESPEVPKAPAKKAATEPTEEPQEETFEQLEEKYLAMFQPFFEKNKPDGTPYGKEDLNAKAKEIIKAEGVKKDSVKAKAIGSAYKIAVDALGTLQ